MPYQPKIFRHIGKANKESKHFLLRKYLSLGNISSLDWHDLLDEFDYSNFEGFKSYFDDLESSSTIAFVHKKTSTGATMLSIASKQLYSNYHSIPCQKVLNYLVEKTLPMSEDELLRIRNASGRGECWVYKYEALPHARESKKQDTRFLFNELVKCFDVSNINAVKRFVKLFDKAGRINLMYGHSRTIVSSALDRGANYEVVRFLVDELFSQDPDVVHHMSLKKAAKSGEQMQKYIVRQWLLAPSLSEDKLIEIFEVLEYTSVESMKSAIKFFQECGKPNLIYDTFNCEEHRCTIISFALENIARMCKCKKYPFKPRRVAVIKFLVETFEQAGHEDLVYSVTGDRTILDDLCFCGGAAVAELMPYFVDKFIKSGHYEKIFRAEGETILNRLATRGQLGAIRYIISSCKHLEDLGINNPNGTQSVEQLNQFLAADQQAGKATQQLQKDENPKQALHKKYPCTCIHSAAYHGHLAVVKFFANMGVNLDVAGIGVYSDEEPFTVFMPGKIPLTALEMAYYQKHFHIADDLVSRGADPTIHNPTTGEVMFSYNSRFEVNQRLMTKNKYDQHGYTAPVTWGIRVEGPVSQSSEETIYQLALRKSISSVSHTEKACKALSLKYLRRAVQELEHRCKTEVICGVDKSGRTILHWAGLEASDEERLPMILYLSEKFKEYKQEHLFYKQDISGLTVLHIVAGKGDLESVIHLVPKCNQLEDLEKTNQQNEDKNKIAFNRGTVIHVAAAEGHLPVVEYLALCGVDLDTLAMNHEVSAFQAAVNEDKTEVADSVIQCTTIGSVNDDKESSAVVGVTALQLAYENDHEHVVEFLLSRGADPTIREPDGNTGKARVKPLVQRYMGSKRDDETPMEYALRKGLLEKHDNKSMVNHDKIFPRFNQANFKNQQHFSSKRFHYVPVTS